MENSFDFYVERFALQSKCLYWIMVNPKLTTSGMMRMINNINSTISVIRNHPKMKTESTDRVVDILFHCRSVESMMETLKRNVKGEE